MADNDSKFRIWVRDHNLEITLGSLAVIGVSGYLLTTNIAAREAAKTAIKEFKRNPPTLKFDVLLNEAEVAEAITKHMTVDETAIAARILQGIVDVQRGAEVFLDARTQ
jgi:hypothetical protein